MRSSCRPSRSGKSGSASRAGLWAPATPSQDIASRQIRVIGSGASGFGRDVVRGVASYIRRAGLNWRINVEFDAQRGFDPAWRADDGLVFAVARGPLVEKLAAMARPMVNCLAHYAHLPLTTVCTDDLAIGRMAAEHFIERSFEKYLFWSAGERSRAAHLRSDGMRQRLAEEGLTMTEVIDRWPDDQVPARVADWPRLIEAVRASDVPMAILAAHDAIARITANHLSAAGIAVPEQAAILGVDNDELQCNISFPPVSSIDIPYQDLGYEAARQLHRLMDGSPMPERPILFGPTGIVERQSTDVIAVDDPRLRAVSQYIRHHACDPCNVDEVADRLGFSRRWLQTQFKKHLGRTPHEEITRIRMTRATHLLRSTQMPIHQIAARCGYPLLRNFGRAFRQYLSDTPANYRALHRP